MLPKLSKTAPKESPRLRLIGTITCPQLYLLGRRQIWFTGFRTTCST
ncbi:hypothetical protein LINPERPRIM_LOCUS33650 [Linum perenne]